MQQPFKTILFGFAFSPTLKVNILEITRIAHFFRSNLMLLHVGEKNDEKEEKLAAALMEIEYPEIPIEVKWQVGKPVEIILRTCEDNDIDLLVLGALQHETLFQFYVGSIARKLTRQVCCSVLLLIKPSAERVPCRHIVVNGLDAPETPLAITDAFYVAHALGAQQVTIVEEIRQKEIHVTVEDDRSLKKANIVKARLRQREEHRVRNIVSNLALELTKDIKIKSQSIFGKRGYSIGHYAEVVRADLLVMNAPGKSSILDRIFPHDIEYILSDLPTDLLIIRNRN
ncbi:MAG: universal stress protein [Aurantibacter sp.]